MTYPKQRRVASDIQERHMTQARFMIEFMNLQSQQGNDFYADVLLCVKRSDEIAGGPALRLANVIWDLEYTLRFPKSKILRAREENSFARLRDAHRSRSKSDKNHVWKGMEFYFPIRQSFRNQEPMSLLEKEDLNLPERQDLVRTFWLLWKYRKKAYVQKVIQLFMKVNPDSRHHFIPQMRVVASAISAFEGRKPAFSKKLSVMNSLMRQQWVKQTEVGDAIGIFQTELNERLSPQ